jgi:hypothetical protein
MTLGADREEGLAELVAGRASDVGSTGEGVWPVAFVIHVNPSARNNIAPMRLMFRDNLKFIRRGRCGQSLKVRDSSWAQPAKNEDIGNCFLIQSRVKKLVFHRTVNAYRSATFQ